MFKTPILIISWQRPEKTLALINVIRKFKPQKLYLACDGPIVNDKENERKVIKTREILDKEINWICEFKKLYSETNNGCKVGVSKAITWFFKNEEQGIILEDDCIPHEDFFLFSEILLNKYQNDSRIWCISAHNNQAGKRQGKGSYYFSRYNHCWGWASWRRCWKFYDPEIKNWPKYKKENILKNIFSTRKEVKYWENIFDNIYFKSQPDTWDYQWTLTCFVNSGLTIIPNINLVNNIGFGKDATHTKKGISSTNNKELILKESGIFPLIHPISVTRIKLADKRVESIIYSGYSNLSIKNLKLIINKLFFKIKMFFN